MVSCILMTWSQKNQYNEAFRVRHRVVSSPYQYEGAVVDSSNLASQYTTH